MGAELKPYPEYEDSGLPWLGRLPAHWQLRRAKYVLLEIDRRWTERTGQLLSVSQYAGVTKRRLRDGSDEPATRSETLEGYKVVATNDLAVNIMLAWNGSLGVAPFDGVVSPAYCVYRFRDGNPWYFHNLLRSPDYRAEIKRRSRGVVESRLRLYSDDLFRVPLPVPPPPEQAGIVRFLGAVDRKVNRFIRAKRRLIEVLTEQKQAIITHAVTKGLNPHAPLKPSGIDWLGDVPEHWEVKRIKQAANILRGKFTHRPRNDPSFYDGPYPFIQTGGVAQADKYISTWSQTLNERGLSVSKLFPAGTLVMTIAANIGDVAVLAIEACFPDSVVGFVPRAGINRDYMYLVFRCMKPVLLREAPVNTQGNLNVERIGAMGVPIPPTAEQGHIVAQTEQDTAQIDASIAAIKREIDLIREYRTRLVADVVTGKLDVRGVTVPDEPPDAADAEREMVGNGMDEDLPEEHDEGESALEVANADD